MYCFVLITWTILLVRQSSSDHIKQSPARVTEQKACPSSRHPANPKSGIGDLLAPRISPIELPDLQADPAIAMTVDLDEFSIPPVQPHSHGAIITERIPRVEQLCSFRGRMMRDDSRRARRVRRACKPRDMLLWRRVSAIPDESRRSGDFLPKLAGESTEVFLCVSFDCDFLGEEE